MSSGAEIILGLVETALTSPSDFMGKRDATRRSHATPVPKEKSPAAHIIAGDDLPDKVAKCGRRTCQFTVRICVRSDSGSKVADPFIIELYKRLSTIRFPSGVSLTPGRIRRETEIADSDASCVDCDFEFTYPTADAFSLELLTAP